MSPSQMAEVSTASNNSAAETGQSPHSLLLLAVWFCCSSNLSTLLKIPALLLQWVPNTSPGGYRTQEQPPPHPVLEFARASSAPSAMTVLRLPSLAPSRSPTLSTYIPGIYRGAAGHREQRIYSRSAFPIIPSRSRGFIPPDQFRPGLREAFTHQAAGTGSVNRASGATIP